MLPNSCAGQLTRAAWKLKLVATCCDCSGMDNSEAAELRRGRAIIEADGARITNEIEHLCASCQRSLCCYRSSLALIEVRLIKHRAGPIAGLAKYARRHLLVHINLFGYTEHDLPSRPYVKQMVCFHRSWNILSLCVIHTSIGSSELFRPLQRTSQSR